MNLSLSKNRKPSIMSKKKAQKKTDSHDSPKVKVSDIHIANDQSIFKSWISTIKKTQLKGIENAGNCGISDASNINKMHSKDIDTESPQSTKKPIIGLNYDQYVNHQLS